MLCATVAQEAAADPAKSPGTDADDGLDRERVRRADSESVWRGLKPACVAAGS